MRPQLKERSCAEPPSWARPQPPRSPPARWPPRASSAPVTARRPRSRRPHRGQHGRLRVHRAGRAGQPDRRRQLDPARGAGGRPVLRQARSERPATTSRSTTPATARGRRLPLAVQAAVPQPELVPVRGAAGRLGRRPGPQLRPDVRPLQGDATRQAAARPHEADRARRPGRARQRRARRRSRTTPSVAGGRDHARCRAAARRSSARPTTRSSSTSAPSSTASTSTSPAGPNIGLGNQGGGKDDVAGYNTHSFVLQVPESEVTRDGKPSPTRRPATRSSACGRRPSGGASASLRPRQAPRLALGAGQPPRQPADQRGHHPDRPEGQVQPRRRPPTTLKNFGDVRAQPRAGAAAERPVQARRQGDQPHGHRPGAADRRARA